MAPDLRSVLGSSLGGHCPSSPRPLSSSLPHPALILLPAVLPAAPRAPATVFCMFMVQCQAVSGTTAGPLMGQDLARAEPSWALYFSNRSSWWRSSSRPSWHLQILLTSHRMLSPYQQGPPPRARRAFQAPQSKPSQLKTQKVSLSEQERQSQGQRKE